NPFVPETPREKREDLIRVSRKGALKVESGVRGAPLVIAQVRHSLAVVALTEVLLDEHPGAKLTTERELRAQHYRDLRNGEDLPAPGRTPDALLLVPTGIPEVEETVAIELDLSRKDRRMMEHMIREYARVKVDRIWWYVTKDRVDRTR